MVLRRRPLALFILTVVACLEKTSLDELLRRRAEARRLSERDEVLLAAVVYLAATVELLLELLWRGQGTSWLGVGLIFLDTAGERTMSRGAFDGILLGFFSHRRRAIGLHLILPLTIKRGHEVHQGKSCSHHLDLFLVATVALAHDDPVELECAVEAHARVVWKLLLDEFELSNALVAVLRDAREQAYLVLVRPRDVFQLSVHLQVCLENFLSNLSTEPLVGFLELSLVLSPHAKQVLVNQRQLVALNVEHLLDLVDLFLNCSHIDLDAEETLDDCGDLLDAEDGSNRAHLRLHVDKETVLRIYARENNKKVSGSGRVIEGYSRE